MPPSQLPHYPPDARLLILNADDFGFCNAINEAIMRVLEAGLVHSTTLMVPCPWSFQAMQYLAAHPEIPFGVHLTAISDPAAYRWRPVTPWNRLPSLVDSLGYFHNFEDRHARLARVNLNELELEFRAQIDLVLKAGLHPTHLDWHALRIKGGTKIFDLLIRLAKDYGLALRVMGQSAIDSLQGQGLPTIDYDFLDSYSVEPSALAAHYTRRLRELPPGLSEWAVHPGINSAELLAIEPGSHFRQSEFNFWTSAQAKEIIEEEGIILLDYRALQTIWREKAVR